MSQMDWVGGGVAPRSLKDIRNQRSSTAETKAQLLLDLGALINKVPPQIMSAGIERTREWRAARDAAAKIAASSRSSIPDLTRAITSMARFSVSAVAA
jgi:hypothetical protein